MKIEINTKRIKSKLLTKLTYKLIKLRFTFLYRKILLWRMKKMVMSEIIPHVVYFDYKDKYAIAVLNSYNAGMVGITNDLLFERWY